ncbi:MAG: hypothetical protein EBZ05_09690 [Verrucomicrobia bacterium]|nr:hypothetical protein [Verrucomicrobiota bacterium]
MKSRPTRIPKKIHPLHHVRRITGMTQAEFAQRIGISTMLLKLIEQCRRPLTDRVKDAIHLVTGIDPVSWNKKKLQSTLGHTFDENSYKWWQMVCQDENENAPKRVLDERIKALELVGKVMEQEQKGVLWEHEFRQFILKTVLRYDLAKPLSALKREIEQSGAKWPEEAFAAPKAAGFKATIASVALKSGG